MTKRVAITSSIYPDPHTHIETVIYGKAGDAMSTALHAARRGRHARDAPAASCSAPVAAPSGQLRAGCCGRGGWSRRTIIVLVMQTLDNAIALRPKLTRSGDVRLQTEQDAEQPEPDVHPGRQRGGRVARRAHRRASRSPRVMEALLNIPSTAHILGGAAIGAIAEHGVVDADQRVFGYENLLVCDGAAVPGERRREPEPHDHRDGRARDEPHSPGRRCVGRARAGCRRRHVAARSRQAAPNS